MSQAEATREPMPEPAGALGPDAPAGPDADRGWLTVRQAAEALGVADSHVRRLCRSGELAAFKISERGGGWVVDAACRPALAIAAGLPVAAVALAGDPLAGLPAAKRAGIRRRLEAVHAYQAAMGHRPANRALREFQAYWIEAWNLGRPAAGRISRSSLLRWDKALRDHGIAGLIDRRRNAGPAACSAEAWDMFRGLYLSEARPAIPMIHELVAAASIQNAWAWPSERTVRRWARQRLDPKLRALGRDPKRFRDRCAPYVERDWTRIPANHLWVADHRQFDVLLPRLDDGAGEWRWGRPWLTAFMDARTWMPVARTISFDAPTGNRVMETFVRGVEEHGQPAELYLDNGKDFRMYRFAGGRKKPAGKGEKIVCEKAVAPMLELLGVGARFAIPYNAKAKTIESWFSIVSERFDKTWATYCGNRPDRRPERLKALHGKAGELHAGGLTIERFAEAFEAWIKTDYALRESPSAAAGGLSPARAFVELRDPDARAVRPAAETLALLLMPSVPVRVEANGVWVKAFGRHYWSDALEDRRCGAGRDLKRKITYRYREDDPSGVFVFDAQTDRFLCVAAPYIGSGLHPLTEAGAADADRLAASMALQRRLAGGQAAELKRLRAAAGNSLLAAGRDAAETLGRLDDPARIPTAPRPIVRLVGGDLDVAGRAAGAHQSRRKAGQAARFALAEALATGTDDHNTHATRPAPRQALEVIAESYQQEESRHEHDAPNTA